MANGFYWTLQSWTMKKKFIKLHFFTLQLMVLVQWVFLFTTLKPLSTLLSSEDYYLIMVDLYVKSYDDVSMWGFFYCKHGIVFFRYFIQSNVFHMFPGHYQCSSLAHRVVTYTNAQYRFYELALRRKRTIKQDNYSPPLSS